MATSHGIIIKQYHADNGIFRAISWVQDFQKRANIQLTTYTGADAHHTNDLADRRIRELQDNGISMMLHAPLVSLCSQTSQQFLQCHYIVSKLSGIITPSHLHSYSSSGQPNTLSSLLLNYLCPQWIPFLLPKNPSQMENEVQSWSLLGMISLTKPHRCISSQPRLRSSQPTITCEIRTSIQNYQRLWFIIIVAGGSGIW